MPNKHGKFDGMGTKWGEGKKREEKRVNKELADRIAAAIPKGALGRAQETPPDERVAAWIDSARQKHPAAEDKMFADLSDKSKLTKPETSEIPEELESVWDPDVEAAFRALRPKQQDFVLAYVRSGNAAEAYRKSHNPMAKDHLASVSGSRLLAYDGIQAVLRSFADRKIEAIDLVQKTLYEAAAAATKPIFGKDEEGQPCLIAEQPDYAVRIKAVEAIAKLHGLNAPDKKEVTGKDGAPLNQTLTDEQINAKLADLLRKAGIDPAVGGEGQTQVNA